MCSWSGRVALFFIGIGLWGPPGLWAQAPSPDPGKALTQYVHEVWQNEQGLPQSTVTSIVQTREGYLWLGTQEGLVRFNGTRFDTFDKRDTPAFKTSHAIRALFEDANDVLWIGTFGGGLVRYADGRFTRQDDVAGNQISSITADREGRLWVGTFDAGLFSLHDGVVTRFAPDDGLDFISTLHVAPDGALWVGTGAGLHRIDGVNRALITTEDGLSNNHIEAVFVDRSGVLWIATRGGVDRYKDGRLLDTARPSLFDDVVLTFFEDPGGSLWIGTKNSGLVRYREGRLDTFTQKDGLTHNGVIALYQDREGSLWVGTDGGGLNRLRDDKFTSYTEREGLPSNMTFPIYEDAEGALWIGSEKAGLSRFGDGVFTAFTTDDGLSSNTVLSLAGDGAGTLWIGTDGGGLNRLKDGAFTTFTSDDGLPNDAISALYDDGAGTLWIGTDGGLSRLRAGQFTNFTPDDGLVNSYVLALRQDQWGALWIGTYGGGLQRLHNGTFTAHYTTTPAPDQQGDGLGSNIVVALYEDHEGTLWIGTYGGGLSRLRHGTLTTYTLQHGLFSDTIYQILEDGQGNLWMSSNLGLFRVSKTDFHAVAEGRLDRVSPVVYGKADGLKSHEMNGGFQPAGWKDRAGRLWFPSIKGVAMIDPAQLRVNTVPPPVVIEAVIVDRENLRETDHTELAPGKDKIDFYFAALSFIDPDNIAYQYKLEGYDEQWSEPTAGHTATYTNLDPGTYTFRVKARNRDGVWNETGASVSFYLKPFFYQTTWFLILCVIGVILLALGGYKARIRQLKARERQLERAVDEHTRDLRQAKERVEKEKEKAERAREVIEAQAEELKKLDRFKTHFFTNVSHEFRTPLTMIIGVLENMFGEDEQCVDASRGEMQMMLRNAQRLLRLINQLLDLSRLESGKMQLQAHPCNLATLLEGIVGSFTPFTEQKGIDLQFACDRDEIALYYEPDKVEKVFFNLLSNAVKFTQTGGRILVSVAEKDNPDTPEGLVEVRVEDTGIGIPKEQLPFIFDRFHQVNVSDVRAHSGTGIGLALAKELVLLHGGAIEVESELGAGATFIVTLRKGTAHFKREDLRGEGLGEAVETASQSPMLEVIGADVNPVRANDQPSTPVSTPDDAPLVLIVDDNLDIRSYIAGCLHGRYRVATATDGEDGLEQARALNPNLILADLMMPRLDGFGLCKALKADDALCHIPIIILTAKTSQGTVIESLEHGADEYISKPFNARELTIRIDNLIKIREQEKALKMLNENLEAKVREQFQQMVEERRAYEQELIAAKERAEATDRVKSAILNNMSHEFRTPLAAILGFTEVLRLDLDEPLQEFVNYIDQNGRRLLNTLNGVIDLATLESRMMVLEQQPVNVSDAARSVVASFQPMAQEKGLTLRIEAAPEMVVPTDPKALNRVLTQLIDNALKFTDEGDVVVRVAEEDGQALLQVRDTGIGISEAFLPSVFEAFKQESEGLSRNHEGSGLGLSLAQCLIQLMGGTIHAESEKGKGSTFSVTLPLSSAAEAPSLSRKDHGPHRKDHADGSEHRSRTIL